MTKAAAKAKARKAATTREATEKTAKTFVDAGFSVEQVGVTTIFFRRVSDDVLEASKALTGGHTMSCPPKRDDNR